MATRVKALVTGMFFALAISAAQADIVYDPKASAFGENVLFNDGTHVGLSIEGYLNGRPDDKVTFTSTESITADGGQARIEGTAGTTFDDVTFFMTNGLDIQRAVFNVNTDTATVAFVTVTEGNGFVNAAYQLNLGNGSNFLTVSAIKGQTIESIKIDSAAGFWVDFKQVRVETVPGPVLGAGLPVLLASIGGLVLLARRRRERTAIA